MPLSRNHCAKLVRIIGVLLTGAVLVACSTVKLAYNNLPEFGYWWLDGYLDFDHAQTPRVRDELTQLLAWHRQNELPKFVDLLQQAQALAPADITPEQACGVADSIRERLLAVSARAEPAAAELALGLSEAQLQQLERKYERSNADYRKEWLAPDPEKAREKRYERMLERSEDFYGRLDAQQRALLRQQAAQSAFDPKRMDAERRRRQQEVLALLRGFQKERTPVAEARAAIHAWIQRIATPQPGPWRDHQQALLQEGCGHVAALHNRTSAEQRAQAVRRLQAYRNDLQQLVAMH